MTKREICEKELCVLWNALLEADGGANNTMMSIASAMKDLILDLAAPQMTNFEKWKAGLTAEETAKKLETSSLVCGFCPARYECAGTGTGCRTHFLEWANAPAKEEK